MIDPSIAMRSWLMKLDALKEIVGENIFWPMLPPSFDPAVSGPAVTIFQRPGTADAEVPLLHPSMQIEGWSVIGDFETTHKIYGVIFNAIHGQNNVDCAPNGVVLSCVCEIPGQDATDPETGWASTFAFFRLIMRAN